jgi:hypothetical protein
MCSMKMALASGAVCLSLFASACDGSVKLVGARVTDLRGPVVCVDPARSELSSFCFTGLDEDRLRDVRVGDCLRVRSDWDSVPGGVGTPENPERVVSVEDLDDEYCDF